jgi:hypothetical protein
MTIRREVTATYNLSGPMARCAERLLAISEGCGAIGAYPLPIQPWTHERIRHAPAAASP